jgi:hypothetical protein
MADTDDTGLQHPGSGLHPADATDDLTRGTDPDPEPQPEPEPDPDLDDEADPPADGDGETADAVPGDGTAGTLPAHGDVDVVRAAVHGRETDAARANLSDDAPTPRDSPAD